MLATKPLTTRETEAMRQAAKSKRRNSHFRTAPDGRLVIDVDDEENEQHAGHESDDDEDDEDIKREDLKDLMETLSLGQRAKNKRKRAVDHDDDDDNDEEDYHFNEKQSQSVHSRYRGKNNEKNELYLLWM